MICGFNSNGGKSSSNGGGGGEKQIKDRGEIIINGDGWGTFPDLDHFNSDHLLSVLTLKDKTIEDDGFGLIWDPRHNKKSSSALIVNPQLGSFHEQNMLENPSLVSLRQLEALFNLTQLLFGLSKSNVVNFTFRDLQFGKHPHSFKKSGFRLLNNNTGDSCRRIDFYEIFESLVNDIVSQGGLDVALTMYKNPMLPMVRQKCLDLISNVTTVPVVAQRLLVEQPWFLDHLLIMIRDGELVGDKIPALSVLIRLLKVILTQRITTAYLKLVDMQYIDFIVDIFDDNRYRKDVEYSLPLFVKFEFMAMQSLTVILGDKEYHTLWSEKAKTRLLNYCMIVLLKATGDIGCNVSNNHIKYAEENATKHSLAHTIMTITELLRYDSNMRSFYKNHSNFKKLVVSLFKKYGAKSVFIELDPGISYAINHLLHVLYIQGINKSSQQQSSYNESKSNTIVPPATSSTIGSSSSTSSLNLGRKCSNPVCDNEETKYKPFKPCPKCGLAAYCSSSCRTANLSTHLNTDCQATVKKEPTHEFVNKQHYYQMSSSASSLQTQQQTVNSNNVLSAPAQQIYAANKVVARRASDNYFKMTNQDEKNGTAPVKTGSINNKLPKYKSNLESNNNNAKQATNDINELDTGGQHFFQHRRSSFNARLVADNGSETTTTTNRHRLVGQKSAEENISRHHFIKNKSSFTGDLAAKSTRGALKATTTSNEIETTTTTNNRLALSRPLKTSTAVCLIDLPNASASNKKSSKHSKKSKSSSSHQDGGGGDTDSHYYFNTIGSQEDELEPNQHHQPESIISKQSSSSKLRYTKNNSNLFYTSPAATTATSSHYYSIKSARNEEPDGGGLVMESQQQQSQPEYHYAEEELQEFITHLCSSEDSEEKENVVDYEDMCDNSDKVKNSAKTTTNDEDEIEVKRFERSSSNRRSLTSMNGAGYSQSSLLSKTANSLTKRVSAIENNNTTSSNKSEEEVDEEDEDESAKIIKVIKEYERSVDFVRNASNLKVMNLNTKPPTNNDNHDDEDDDDDDEDDENEEIYLNHHYIKDSLCLNSNNINSRRESLRSSSGGGGLGGGGGPIHLNSDMTLKSNYSTSPMYFTTNNRPMPNIIINNSIHSADFAAHTRRVGDDEAAHHHNQQDSTVLTNQVENKSKSSKLVNQELVNSEMNMFKRNVKREEVEAEPYHPVTNPFKVPIVPPLRKVGSSKQQLNKGQSSSSYSQLKVLPECEQMMMMQQVVDTTKQSLSSSIITDDASKLSGLLPISSTPIHDDSPNTLQSKRKQLFTADMTINAVPSSQKTSSSSSSQYSSIKKSSITNKPDENVIEETGNRPPPRVVVDIKRNQNSSSSHQMMTNGVSSSSHLNLSTLAALENVASSVNLVSVAQVELPKQVIKSELKKKCSIQ